MSFISRGDHNRVFNSVPSADETPPLPPKRYKELEDMYANVPNIRLTKKIRHNKQCDGNDESSDDVCFDDVMSSQQHQQPAHHYQYQTQELCKYFIFIFQNHIQNPSMIK